MKNYLQILTILLIMGTSHSCGEDFLDKEPIGVTLSSQLANKSGLDALLIGAYAQLDGLGHTRNAIWPHGASNFVWGSVPSDNSYKGSDLGDQPAMLEIEQFLVTSTTFYLDEEWRGLYDGISRCNEVIRLASEAHEKETIDLDQHQQYIAEARFLRGHYHFDLKQEFGNIPYIDESVEDFFKAGNLDQNGDYLNAWPLIQADFEYAIEHLPVTREQPGRCDQWAAKAYLAKTHMWQMDLIAAKPLLDDILEKGPHRLVDHYHDNFRIATNNNQESIWEYQSSVESGSQGFNANASDVLNFPHGGGPAGCCGFHQPSSNGVNAHQTNSNGLPLLDTFNDSDVVNDEGLESSEEFIEHTGPLDPRLDWSVGRRGIPYLDWGDHPGKNWVRDQAFAGPYSPKKNVHYLNEDEALTTFVGGWIPGGNANNVRIIRLAHIILWRAEVAAAENDLDIARDLVNRIRKRADKFHVQEGGEIDDGTHPNDAANYQVGLYPAFPDQEYAWKAIKFEHRLEFFMEGFRFFNLVRWGDADVILNEYFQEEKTKRSYLDGVSFTSGKNEYFPIPQVQIDIVGPEVLKQNPGY